MTATRRNVGVDVGQSTIRVLTDGDREPRTGPGSSHPEPVSELVDRLATLFDRFDRDSRDGRDRREQGSAGWRPGRVVVGMTTVPATAAERRALASSLLDRLGAAEVWVTGDELTAHAGAFGGEPGVVLVAGTGVACLAADPVNGRARSCDGAGHLLGDEGGGFWLGRHVIRAALAADDGRGPATLLVDAVAERYGGLDDLATRLHTAPDAVDRIARAAADALAAAVAGDDVARRLVATAVERLTATVIAATRALSDVSAPAPVALSGRLLGADSPLAQLLRSRLVDELGPAHSVELRPDAPLTGAVALAAEPIDSSPYRQWMEPGTRGAGPRVGAASRFLTAAGEVVSDVADGELPAIARAAQHLADTITRGGLVHVFGTGHSHLLAEELFYRAGGLAAINPVLVTSLMLHEGALRSTRLERTEGLAEEVLGTVELSPDDSMIVVSNSGGNTVTNDIAERCRTAGVPVVAILSRRHAATKPGARLVDVADVVIDNHGAVGDAAIEIDGCPAAVGPTSTIAGAAIAHALVAATVEELIGRGVEPAVLRSANLPDGDAHNERLLAPLRGRISAL